MTLSNNTTKNTDELDTLELYRQLNTHKQRAFLDYLRAIMTDDNEGERLALIGLGLDPEQHIQ